MRVKLILLIPGLLFNSSIVDKQKKNTNFLYKFFSLGRNTRPVSNECETSYKYQIIRKADVNVKDIGIMGKEFVGEDDTISKEIRENEDLKSENDFELLDKNSSITLVVGEKSESKQKNKFKYFFDKEFEKNKKFNSLHRFFSGRPKDNKTNEYVITPKYEKEIGIENPFRNSCYGVYKRIDSDDKIGIEIVADANSKNGQNVEKKKKLIEKNEEDEKLEKTKTIDENLDSKKEEKLNSKKEKELNRKRVKEEKKELAKKKKLAKKNGEYKKMNSKKEDKLEKKKKVEVKLVSQNEGNEYSDNKKDEKLDIKNEEDKKKEVDEELTKKMKRKKEKELAKKHKLEKKMTGKNGGDVKLNSKKEESKVEVKVRMDSKNAEDDNKYDKKDDKSDIKNEEDVELEKNKEDEKLNGKDEYNLKKKSEEKVCLLNNFIQTFKPKIKTKKDIKIEKDQKENKFEVKSKDKDEYNNISTPKQFRKENDQQSIQEKPGSSTINEDSPKIIEVILKSNDDSSQIPAHGFESKIKPLTNPVTETSEVVTISPAILQEARKNLKKTGSNEFKKEVNDSVKNNKFYTLGIYDKNHVFSEVKEYYNFSNLVKKLEEDKKKHP